MKKGKTVFSDCIYLINKIVEKNPDLRLGQIIVNCVKKKEELFYLSDGVIYERLVELYKQCKEV